MTEHGSAGTGGEQRETIARDAYLATTGAVTRIAGETGAELRERKPGSEGSAGSSYAEPGAGLWVACAVAVAAGRTVRDYIRYAREDRLNWREIGASLDLEAPAGERGLSVAETAFDYAVGKRTGPWNLDPPHSTGHARRATRRSVTAAQVIGTWRTTSPATPKAAHGSRPPSRSSTSSGRSTPNRWPRCRAGSQHQTRSAPGATRTR